MLVRDGERNVLVETGIGAFFPPALRQRYGVQEEHHVLLDSLAAVGLDDADIDVVLLTHLHFDHAGGQLRFVERRSVEGTEPREFAFSPGGRFVLVANQNSDQLRVFARDPQSGQVGKTLQSVEVGSPSDLRFVAVP
ncbi:TPA: beta-propeller fold lactonase family protein [Pseudomonas aeruginosa]|nr:beta-propeller fold lactonase family protein [Pseudomonas aeruginosa]HEK3703862.1 beta-propeller fold lactonase family protein [Pseudomonas aeruginosa]